MDIIYPLYPYINSQGLDFNSKLPEYKAGNLLTAVFYIIFILDSFVSYGRLQEEVNVSRSTYRSSCSVGAVCVSPD